MGALAPSEYPGGELELFAEAHNWKGYLRDQMEGFLGERVLEVGAGIGATTDALFRDGVRRWVCLEPDPSLAGRLRRRRETGELPAACAVVRGTTEALGGATGFDTVLYVDVLEHIADDVGELERAAGLLAPGGRLVVLAPAHAFLFTPFDRAVGHYRRYGRGHLVERAPGHLEVVRARYLDSVGLLASLANRVLLRSSMPTRGQIRVWDRLMVPASRLVDPFLAGRVGKSVLVAWRAPPQEEGGRATRALHPL